MKNVIRAAAMLGLLGIPAAASSVFADDLIYLRQANSESVIPVPATIEDFTGRYITYRTNAGSKQALTSSVESIKHAFSKTFERGEARFKGGDFPGAEQEWKQDLADESKHWVQREIRSWLIRAAWRQEHWADAGNQFLAIIAEDPETFHWSIVPLIWTPGAIRPADRSAARDWLRDERPAARLVGASLLLKDADASIAKSAAQVLEALLRDSSSQIAGLAKAQLWRNRFDAPVSDNELASWRGHINFLPADLRGGPQYLLGAAYRRRGEYDRAAAEFLWVPLMYSQNEPTAARASLEAGESLLHAARREEALKTLQETAANYSWSSAARDAKSRIAQVEQEP